MFRGVPASPRGFSILEILIALALGLSIISAVVLMSFSGQTSLTRSELYVATAVTGAELIEYQKALANKDFNLINSTSTIKDGMRGDITVSLQGDRVSKLVNVRVTNLKNEEIFSAFSSLISNLENVSSPDTCDSFPVGDWQHPTLVSYEVNALLGTTTGAYSLAQIDIFDGVLYLGVRSTMYRTDPTLIAIDVVDPLSPSLQGAIDTASTTSGLSGLRVVRDYAAAKTYVFGANAGNFSKGQLQIFDVTDATHMSHISTYKIPLAYAPSAGNGNSLYYKDGLAYIGLTSAPGVVEFNVIDVRDVYNPEWRGGYAFGSGVEAIIVKDGYAYVATNDVSREFAVLDVSNPGSPILGGVYDAPGSSGSGYGRSEYVLGDLVYFGRTWSLNASTPEFYILKEGDRFANPTVFASRDIGTTSPATYGVYGTVVRYPYAYLLTKSSAGGSLHVLDTSDAADISSRGFSASLPLPANGGGVSLDCEGNTIYIGSNDVGGSGYISIVRPG